MSQLFVDNIKNRTGGAIGAPSGAVVTGVVTATTFDGNVTGVAATFTGNVSIGGTLTYEDVTNIDSVGIITARTGIKVLAGGINAVGVVTATGGVQVGSGQSFGANGPTAVYYGDGSNLSGVESWNQFDTWLYGGG